MNVLDEICAAKRLEVALRMKSAPLAAVESMAAEADAPRGFIAALRAGSANGRPALIGEIKKASPSVGLIRPDFDPAAFARDYAGAGASCLSVLTETRWFQGRDEDLKAARAACPLPALRKDFMVDPYQIVESRAMGADCVLLIMAALSDAQARELKDAADRLGMDILTEIHDADERERAVALGVSMIGVNSRNLKTLEVSLDTAETLAAGLPPGMMKIAESGIRTHADIRRLQAAGYEGFLVGESLMRQPDLKKAVRSLLGET